MQEVIRFLDGLRPVSIRSSPFQTFPTRLDSASRLRMPKRPVHKCRCRPPFFHPVPLRVQFDGWTEVRQREFLAQLYVTGSVSAALRSVCMSRVSAYRLRERAGAERFAHAWDRVLRPPGSGHCKPPEMDWRKVTDRQSVRQIETGLVQPVIYRGRMAGIRRKADNPALLRMLRRSDARSGTISSTC